MDDSTMTEPGLCGDETKPAFEYGEYHASVVCVGAPVVGVGGVQAEAAFSIAGPVSQVQPRVLGARLRATAQRVAATLVRRGDEAPVMFRVAELCVQPEREARTEMFL